MPSATATERREGCTAQIYAARAPTQSNVRAQGKERQWSAPGWVRTNSGISARKVRPSSRTMRKEPRMVPIGVPRGTQLVYSRSEEHTSELQSRENLVCRL